MNPLSNAFQKIKIYGPLTFSKYFLKEFVRKAFYEKIMHSYSQLQEDLEIDKLLNYKAQGYYVDVGANDPSRFSNTKRFYEKGWKGINIDPNPKSIKKFETERPRDLNLAIGVSNEATTLEFYEIFPDTLSTFSKSEMESYIKQGYKLATVSKIQVQPLAQILSKFASDKQIDFLTLDTEGFDLEVLQGNDWIYFRPSVICVENHSHDKNTDVQIKNNTIHEFIINKGYVKKYDSGLNSLYLRKDFQK